MSNAPPRPVVVAIALFWLLFFLGLVEVAVGLFFYPSLVLVVCGVLEALVSMAGIAYLYSKY